MDNVVELPGLAPILEFDSAEAVIEPSVLIKPRDVPAHVVLCYFQDVIERVVQEHDGRLEMISKEGQGTTFTVRLVAEVRSACPLPGKNIRPDSASS